MDDLKNVIIKVSKMEELLKRLDKELFGNGQPGMLKILTDSINLLGDKISKLETKQETFKNLQECKYDSLLKQFQERKHDLKWSITTAVALLAFLISLYK